MKEERTLRLKRSALLLCLVNVNRFVDTGHAPEDLGDVVERGEDDEHAEQLGKVGEPVELGGEDELELEREERAEEAERVPLGPELGPRHLERLRHREDLHVVRRNVTYCGPM